MFQESVKLLLIYIVWTILKGDMVLLALVVLMPSIAYIPKAVLASVIITSVIFMVELKELKPMWKTNSKRSYLKQWKCDK